MKKSIVILAALVAPSMGFAQTGPRPISLPEALDLARRNAPQMISARGQLRTSTMSVRVAKWAAFNPLNNLALSYSSGTGGGGEYDQYGELRTRPASDWNFGQSYGGASLTLFDGGRKFSDIRRANAQVDAAETNEIQQRFTIASSVKQQYYLILQYRESEAAALSQIAQTEQQLAAASARVRAGTAVIADTLTASIALGSARLALLQARNNAANSGAQLTRLTGSDFPVTAMVSDTTDLAPLQLSDAELIPLAEQGPNVRSSMSSVAVSRAAEKSATAVRWPTITTSAGFSRSNREKNYDFGAGPMNYSWNFSLGASYQLWNGYTRESSILSARVNLDNAEANLREARLTARQNITQQLNSLRTAEAQLVIARQNVTAAEIALRVQTTRYEVGAGLLLDVLNAQNQLNNSRATLIQQRFTLRNTRAQIETLIGRELPQ